MKPFIKVIELWTPTQDRKGLTLADSYYGEYADFNKQSQDISFLYNEGLPGTAWAQSRPIIITDLEDSCFVRKAAAKKSGITCAIAVPIMAGQFLLSVIVMLCGDKKKLAGAIELWGINPHNSSELHLADGYYGSLKSFEKISRRTYFPKGSGLPGTVWDYHIPQIVADLSSSSSFQRATNASMLGITTTFGIPLIYDDKHEFVLTFLSGKGAPIARRFEIWLPDRDHNHMSLHSGHSDIPYDIFSNETIEKGQGLIGQVWQTGCPEISRNPVEDGIVTRASGKHSLNISFAIPIVEDAALKSIVVFSL